MHLEYGNPEDIVSWMELVNHVSWNFPGLETSDKIEEHKNTVLRFMGRKEALCVNEEEKIVVSPSYRRNGIASMLLIEAFTKLDNGNKIVPQAEEQFEMASNKVFMIPWGHIKLLIDKCHNNPEKFNFYIDKVIENNWSRAVLSNFLDTDLYERQGQAITN